VLRLLVNGCLPKSEEVAIKTFLADGIAFSKLGADKG